MSVLAANSQLMLVYQRRELNKQLGRIRGQGKPCSYGGCGICSDQQRRDLSSSWRLGKIGETRRVVQRAASFWERGGDVVEMEEISDCEQLDLILLQAKDLSQPILIDWMAAWCRKCIYLKPKLDKLAAEYGTKLKFYCVDVNNVPQTLVKRGNISKMPTIQLWKDGEWKAEVIGGHKAWLVVDEVREMIQKFV